MESAIIIVDSDSDNNGSDAGDEIETYNDCVLVANKVGIAANKASLMAHSEYFRALLTCDMKEKYDKVFNVAPVDDVGLRYVIDYTNEGTVELKMSTISSVINAATYLQMSNLLDDCDVFLAEKITLQNCVKILTYGENLVKTWSVSIELLTKKFFALSISQRNAMSCKSLAAVLGSDKLRVPFDSEWCLIKIVRDWMRANEGVDVFRKQKKFDVDSPMWASFTELVRQIRWPLFGDKVLPDKYDTVKELMNKIPQCRLFLTQSDDYHKYIHKQPVLQTPRTEVRCDGSPRLVAYHDHLRTYNIYKRKQIYNRDFRLQRKITIRGSIREPDEPQTCSMNNFLYVSGGTYEASYKSKTVSLFSTYRYDPRFNKWWELPPMSTARHEHVFVTYGAELYAIGGVKMPDPSDSTENTELSSAEANPSSDNNRTEIDSDSEYNNKDSHISGELYDIATNEWSSIPSMPFGMSCSAGCVFRHHIYISGGTKLHKVLRYHAMSQTWYECSALTHGRHYHIMQPLGDFLYVVGGICGFDVKVLDIEQYSVETNQWTDLDEHLQMEIYLHGSLLHEGNIYIVGGMRVDKDRYTDERCYNSLHVMGEDSPGKIWIYEECRIPWKYEFTIPHHGCDFLYFPWGMV